MRSRSRKRLSTSINYRSYVDSIVNRILLPDTDSETHALTIPVNLSPRVRELGNTCGAAGAGTCGTEYGFFRRHGDGRPDWQ